MAMADWTQLPDDLLRYISKHLDTCHDVIRYRSVCCTWRSATTSPLFRLAPRFPSIPTDSGIWDNLSGYFVLRKRTVFLIESQTYSPTSRVIKIEHVHHVPNIRIRLLNPLSGYSFSFGYLHSNSPRVLDLLAVKVLQLGEEYRLDYFTLHGYFFDMDMCVKKVALSFLDDNDNEFILLSITDSGKLVTFKSRAKRWTKIQDISSPYDDVILCKGKFYAVDTKGRTIVVGFNLETSVVVEVPVDNNSVGKKYLVESNDEVLLVDMFSSFVVDQSLTFAWTGNFKVYKLHEAGKKWIEVKDVDNRVLFLGTDCTFSASAEDLCLQRGNYIIFKPTRVWNISNICVFSLENGRRAPISNFPIFENLFLPPPSWISSRTLNEGKNRKSKKIMKRITDKITKLVTLVTKGRQTTATLPR